MLGHRGIATGALASIPREVGGAPAVFAGTAALLFAQTGGFSGGSATAGTTALVFGQSGDLFAARGLITLVDTAIGSALSGGNVTVTLPVGTAEGDVVYANAVVTNGLDVGDIDMVPTSSGWTELADLYRNDVNACNQGVYRKVMGSTPDTTFEFPGTGNANDGAAVTLIVLRGVDTTTPEDTAVTTAGGISSGQPNNPAITTVTAHAWVLALGASSEFVNVALPPANYINLRDTRASDINAANSMLATREITVPGAEDPAVWSDIVGGTSDRLECGNSCRQSESSG